MTNEQIKKALKICADSESELCKHCPNYDYKDGFCFDNLQRQALALITEQEQENEQLKAEIKQAKIDVLTELKKKCKFDGHTVAVYKNDIDEMIEELKK